MNIKNCKTHKPAGESLFKKIVSNSHKHHRKIIILIDANKTYYSLDSSRCPMTRPEVTWPLVRRSSKITHYWDGSCSKNCSKCIILALDIINEPQELVYKDT